MEPSSHSLRKELNMSWFNFGKLPVEIEQCIGLKELVLFYCEKLGMEPFSIPELKNLKVLNMFNCGLEKFPDGIQHCISLEELDLSSNSSLGMEPFSIPELKNLKTLNMMQCGLEKFPDGIQHCISLEHLYLSQNPSLGMEPFSIPELKNLKTLNMMNCGLKKFPDGIQHCISLEELDLTENLSFGMEPFSIPELKNLKALNMMQCGLEKFPDGIQHGISLEQLDLWSNPSLGMEPFSIPELKNLKTLNMINCGLKKFPNGIQHCISLEELSLSFNCSLGMESFSIPELKNLKTLNMVDCGLKKFPDGIQHCISLEKLSLSENLSLGMEPFSIPELKNLKTLIFVNCGLKKFPNGIQRCISLENLHFSGNPSFGMEPFSIPELKNLKVLNMIECGLKKFPDGIQHCISLENLHFSGNPSLGMEPFSIPELKNLKTLNMNSCGLKKFPDGIQHCISLEKLHFSGNPSLGMEPFSIPELKNLKTLYMMNCGLKKFPNGIQHCISLENLHLPLNPSLGMEPFSIPELKNLKTLHMINCGLKKFPDGIEKLIVLEKLNLTGNILRELPNHFTVLIERNVAFDISRNVLCQPPQVICNNGKAILKYFEEIARFGKTHPKRLRVLVIGNQGAGKTSLVNSLLMGQSMLTEQHERTEGIEIRKWFPDPANIDLELEIWDFGGHLEYQSVSHYFIEKHCLCLLVVDLSAYEMTDESYNENIGKWIDELKSIVLRPVVMVCATKVDLVGEKSASEKCDAISVGIAKQEDADRKSITRDLEVLEKQDGVHVERIEKLKVLARERPVLPKVIVATWDEESQSTNGETVIVTTALRQTYLYSGAKSLAHEVMRVGGDPALFPHLDQTLPLLWVEIEELLPVLREDMRRRNVPPYMTYEKLESWLCDHSQDFREAVDRRETLQAVVGYLVTLGKVVRFERVSQLKEFVFPDPEWLIMLIKNVVHHNLDSHLLYRKDFSTVEMDEFKFEREKKELISHGRLSRSLLRCVWYDAVPGERDFNRLFPLLQHFDVGYPMTVKEARDLKKQMSERYILIPALMPEFDPHVVEDDWPLNPLEDQLEVKSVYKFCSIIPVGLFERQMARSHRGSHYMRHWKGGFFGLVYAATESDEVKFLVTKGDREIEVSARISNRAFLNMLWEVVMRLHQIFKSLVNELWPELRYTIWNRCYQCGELHLEMDFEKLLEDPTCYNKAVTCDEPTGRPLRLRKELVYPPQEVVEKLKKELTESSFETYTGGRFTIYELNASDYYELCTELNKPNAGKDYKKLAGLLGYTMKEAKTFELKENPADALLSDWGTTSKNDVKKLVGILKKMSRDDLADMLVKVSYNRKRPRERSDVLSVEQKQVDLKKRRQDVGSVKHLDESSGKYSGEGLDETVKNVERKRQVESSDEDCDKQKNRSLKKKSRKCNESSEQLEQRMKKMEGAGSSKETSEDAHAQLSRFYVRDLGDDVRSKVCQMLNETTVPRNDFRRLAAKMKFEKEEIDEIAACDNPTDALLDEWGTRKDSTVNNLIKLLQKMNRNDVVHILEISMQQKR